MLTMVYVQCFILSIQRLPRTTGIISLLVLSIDNDKIRVCALNNVYHRILVSPIPVTHSCRYMVPTGMVFTGMGVVMDEVTCGVTHVTQLHPKKVPQALQSQNNFI